MSSLWPGCRSPISRPLPGARHVLWATLPGTPKPCDRLGIDGSAASRCCSGAEDLAPPGELPRESPGIRGQSCRRSPARRWRCVGMARTRDRQAQPRVAPLPFAKTLNEIAGLSVGWAGTGDAQSLRREWRRARLRLTTQGKGAGESDLANVRGLEPFRAFDHLELHVVSFGKRAEAVGDDCRVVDEDIFATILRYETEPLRIIEPLDRTLRHCCNLLKREPSGPGEPPAGLAGLKTPKKSRPDDASGGQSLLRNGRKAQRIACHKVMLGNDFVNGVRP